jgi:hypothetical protein
MFNSSNETCDACGSCSVKAHWVAMNPSNFNFLNFCTHHKVEFENTLLRKGWNFEEI